MTEQWHVALGAFGSAVCQEVIHQGLQRDCARCQEVKAANQDTMISTDRADVSRELPTFTPGTAMFWVDASAPWWHEVNCVRFDHHEWLHAQAVRDHAQRDSLCAALEQANETITVLRGQLQQEAADQLTQMCQVDDTIWELRTEIERLRADRREVFTIHAQQCQELEAKIERLSGELERVHTRLVSAKTYRDLARNATREANELAARRQAEIIHLRAELEFRDEQIGRLRMGEGG